MCLLWHESNDENERINFTMAVLFKYGMVKLPGADRLGIYGRIPGLSVREEDCRWEVFIYAIAAGEFFMIIAY